MNTNTQRLSGDLSRRCNEILKLFRSTVSNKSLVSQFLLDAEKELKEYQAEISRLQTAIHAVENKRNRLYRSLLSPIYTLPPEILVRIFQFLCGGNSPSRTLAPEPIRLAAVCGIWRDLALSTPRLWTSISLDMRDWSSRSRFRPRVTRVTELFMERSQQSPLQISLTFGGNRLVLEAPQPLEKLVKNCDRWESLNLHIVSPAFPFPTFQPIHRHLPALKSLSITYPPQTTGGLVLLNLFDSCPSLDTLQIFTSILDVEKTRLPWTQLKTLQLYNSSNSPALSILSRCREVENLKVSKVGGIDDNHANHIVSDSVKALSITQASHQDDVDNILRHSTFHQLTTLNISTSQSSFGTEPWLWNDRVIKDFLPRSSPTITSLHLGGPLPLNTTQTLSLLAMLPAITHFSFENHGKLTKLVMKDLLNGLIMDDISTPLLPSLSTLVLVLSSRDVDEQAFVEFLSSRWKPGGTESDTATGFAPLYSVSLLLLTRDREVEQDSLERLRHFRDAGMRLHINYSNQ